jgi:hypothetical protein
MYCCYIQWTRSDKTIESRRRKGRVRCTYVLCMIRHKIKDGGLHKPNFIIHQIMSGPCISNGRTRRSLPCSSGA